MPAPIVPVPTRFPPTTRWNYARTVPAKPWPLSVFIVLPQLYIESEDNRAAFIILPQLYRVRGPTEQKGTPESCHSYVVKGIIAEWHSIVVAGVKGWTVIRGPIQIGWTSVIVCVKKFISSYTAQEDQKNATAEPHRALTQRQINWSSPGTVHVCSRLWNSIIITRRYCTTELGRPLGYVITQSMVQYCYTGDRVITLNVCFVSYYFSLWLFNPRRLAMVRKQSMALYWTLIIRLKRKQKRPRQGPVLVWCRQTPGCFFSVDKMGLVRENFRCWQVATT